MSEFIPVTPYGETTPERFYWDKILRALNILGELDDEVNQFDEAEALKDETEEDALVLVFNYATMVSVPENTSSDLSEVFELLEANGLIEESTDEV
jgi:hypothetical protein